MDTAERIARLIGGKGWTQEEAALELGVSRFTVNQLVMGGRRLTPEMAVRLETVFEDAQAERLLSRQTSQDLALARETLYAWRTNYAKQKGKGRR